MACLLGYLNLNGIKVDLLRLTCASVIQFSLLITSLTKIIVGNQVVGRDVITFTSTLYTFFRAYLPKTCFGDKVYELALLLCNLISHKDVPPKSLPIMVIHFSPDKEATKFLSDLKLDQVVYFWQGDTSEDFPWFNLEIQSEEAIETAYNPITSFIYS